MRVQKSENGRYILKQTQMLFEDCTTKPNKQHISTMYKL